MAAIFAIDSNCDREVRSVWIREGSSLARSLEARGRQDIAHSAVRESDAEVTDLLREADARDGEDFTAVSVQISLGLDVSDDKRDVDWDNARSSVSSATERVNQVDSRV